MTYEQTNRAEICRRFFEEANLLVVNEIKRLIHLGYSPAESYDLIAASPQIQLLAFRLEFLINSLKPTLGNVKVSFGLPKEL